MMVARHGMPGMLGKENRPVGCGMMGYLGVVAPPCRFVSRVGQNFFAQQEVRRNRRSHRTLRHGITAAVFQAINCLATFIRSLRDKVRRSRKDLLVKNETSGN